MEEVHKVALEALEFDLSDKCIACDGQKFYEIRFSPDEKWQQISCGACDGSGLQRDNHYNTHFPLKDKKHMDYLRIEAAQCDQCKRVLETQYEDDDHTQTCHWRDLTMLGRRTGGE